MTGRGERRRRQENPDSPTLFAGDVAFEELEAVSVEPERFARLLVDPPMLYFPGQPPPEPPDQMKLL